MMRLDNLKTRDSKPRNEKQENVLNVNFKQILEPKNEHYGR